MKFRLICIAAGLLFVTALAFGDNDADPVLVCRGGGNLSLEYKNSAMTIKFKKAAQAVDENWNGIAPGECSFQDRAVDAGEPNKIKWPITNFSITWTGKKETSLHPNQVKALRTKEKFQSFHVKDDGRGSFKVVKLGESREK